MLLRNRVIELTLVALSLALTTQAEDRERCSNATLHGSYGLHATGAVVGVGDFAAVGRLTYDGEGDVAGKLFVNVCGEQ
jgi:hypothetical protein